MGNDCLRNFQESQTKQNETSQVKWNETSEILVGQYRQLSHINSEGVPVANAYKRFVKPPTTVGRQSIIVRNLEQNQQIPQWIWDNNVWSSKTKKAVYTPQPLSKNRKTFEQIQGKFQGVQTINMSKLYNQRIPMTMSEKVEPHKKATQFVETTNPTSYQPPNNLNNQETNIRNYSSPRIEISGNQTGLKRTFSTQKINPISNPTSQPPLQLVRQYSNSPTNQQAGFQNKQINNSQGFINYQIPINKNFQNYQFRNNNFGQNVYVTPNFVSVNNSLQQQPSPFISNQIRY